MGSAQLEKAIPKQNGSSLTEGRPVGPGYQVQRTTPPSQPPLMVHSPVSQFLWGVCTISLFNSNSMFRDAGMPEHTDQVATYGVPRGNQLRTCVATPGPSPRHTSLLLDDPQPLPDFSANLIRGQNNDILLPQWSALQFTKHFTSIIFHDCHSSTVKQQTRQEYRLIR